jgi:hypothetical protein
MARNTCEAMDLEWYQACYIAFRNRPVGHKERGGSVHRCIRLIVFNTLSGDRRPSSTNLGVMLKCRRALILASM